MKIVGIIVEYNPFHNGHHYQLKKVKELLDCDYIVVAISGDFVQRGEPAIFDKYIRTRMALLCGADLVVEIPSIFATSSASDFAQCAVSLFHQMGIINVLCFGSELGELTPLSTIANCLLNESSTFQSSLKKLLKSGQSYPKALYQTLLETYPEHAIQASTFALPNNILGIEYIKSLKYYNSPIQPYTIKREGHGYHDETITDAFASASAIRKSLKENHLSLAYSQMPKEVQNLLESSTPLYLNDFSNILNYQMLQMSNEEIIFSSIFDISDSLSDRLTQQVLSFDTFSHRITQAKTKEFTHARISRCLLHLLLGHKKEDAVLFKSQDFATYIRILGFQKQASPLLSKLKKSTNLPIVTKVAAAKMNLSPIAYKQFQYDLFASALYQSTLSLKTGKSSPNEYTRSILRL